MSSQWDDLKVKDAQILQWWRETLHAKEGDGSMIDDEKETSHDPKHKTFSVDTCMLECCSKQHEMINCSCCPTTQEDTSTMLLAASTLHIFEAFREEQVMVTPYASEYCAEDGEPLFDVFKTLYDHSSSKNHQQSLSRDARFNPNHAYHVLWAKQALDDQQQQQQRDIIQWVQTFCEPVRIPTKEWILLIPAREFIVEESLRQIKTLCWDWLISTLGNVLTDWGLLDESSSSMTMIQGLMNPSLHDQWKQQEDRVPIQCLLFLARTYCAMKLLRNKKSRVPKSPTLLAKILRCVSLLQLPQHRAPDGMDLHLLYKLGISRSSHLKKKQRSEEEALYTSGSMDIMGGTNKAHDSVFQDGSSSCTNVVTSWDEKTDTTEEKLIKLYNSSADPFARRLLQQAMSIPEFLLRYPVEQLDMNTGHVLKTFPSGYQALGSISDTLLVVPFYQALMGRRTSRKDPDGHLYEGYFWRCKGSSAQPKLSQLPKSNHGTLIRTVSGGQY